MISRRTRALLFAVFAAFCFLFLWQSNHAYSLVLSEHTAFKSAPKWPVAPLDWQDTGYRWENIKTNYPVISYKPLPNGPTKQFPRVQAQFPKEAEPVRQQRLERLEAVKQTFLKSWKSYRQHAWMADELEPVSGGKRNPFGGWAATLVDSLDTLFIMGLHDEFSEAVAAVDDIDFTHTDLKEINIFETTIRYLGGFLSAYELSEDKRLLRKAVQVGEMIFKAFDTPNHMPITRWDPHAALKGEKQEAGSGVLVAEIGSLCMELTRLSQITGEPKWFDAAQGITDVLVAQQDKTELPGLWPLVVNAKELVFNQGSVFTLGAMADSVYEYLPKMAAMTGGKLAEYQVMYEKAMDTASKHNFWKPMTPTNESILVSGPAHTKHNDDKQWVEYEYQGQHLVCFAGGMLAIGGRLFNRPDDVEKATQLTDGCIYTYKAFPHGVMPETFYMAPCKDAECEWDEKRWKQEVLKANGKPEDAPIEEAEGIISSMHLPQGFTRIPDTRYILRPEAIESVMILYRVTARQDLADSAWDMFTAIEKTTKTDLANTAVSDVADPTKSPTRTNSMESFWMGETLKYFYLTFSEPSLISLDDYVFNTEAHPFRRLK